MCKPLFEKLFEDGLRDAPVSMKEFIDFGLTPADYVQYIALQCIFQGESVLSEYARLWKTESSQRLIDFCIDKNLISSDRAFVLPLYRRDAVYWHGWYQYPFSADEFRLKTERTLAYAVSLYEEDVIQDLYGIRFYYPNCTNEELGPANILVTASSGHSHTMSRTEISQLRTKVSQDLKQVEHDINQILSTIPQEPTTKGLDAILGKIKTLYELEDKATLLENLLDTLRHSEGIVEPRYTRLSSRDTLYVLCDGDSCKDNWHTLHDTIADIPFHNNSRKEVNIRRCASCGQYQLLWDEFDKLWHSFGLPNLNVVYQDNDIHDFSDFPTDSKFSRMGYSVGVNSKWTKRQRQDILRRAIENGFATKVETTDYLMRRININGRKEGNEIAVKEWTEDLEFVLEI